MAIVKMASEAYVDSKVGGKYTKPGNGIPASDLAAAVQASLGKADTAVSQISQISETLAGTVKTYGNQDIGGSKRFTSNTVIGGSNETGSGNPRTVLWASGAIDIYRVNGNPYINFHHGAVDGYTSSISESAPGVLQIKSPNHARLSLAPIVDPGESGYSSLQIATVGVVKTRQTAVSNPTASGTATAFIDSISQNSNGDITVTKKNIPDDYFNAVEYDSTSKKILFKHGTTTKAQIDATDFIKDGMVSTVAISGGNLVITFNTDAGQDPISIPLTNIFNPANYYDKTATDELLAAKQSTISDLAAIRSGAAAGATAYQKPSGGITASDLAAAVQTSLGKADTALQAHQDISSKADVSALRYDLASETVINTASQETVEGETVNYGAATLADRTGNRVSITAALDELRVTFPPAVSGKLRDFGLRVEVGTGSAALTAPALVPVAPTGETIKLENNAKQIPALADGTATAKGVTLLYFSESAPGVFFAKGEQVEEVA